MTEISREEVETKLSELEVRMNTRIAELRPGWAQRNATVISAGAAVATVFLAIWFYNTQVSLNRSSLQNSLIYQMQKDQRAAVMDYAGDRSGPEYILAQMQSIRLLPLVPVRLGVVAEATEFG
jgi:hypothetical protein